MVRPALAAVALGALHALSIATPWNGQPLWWLQVLALAALVGVLARARSARHAGLLAWLFATAWIAGCTWWLFISMHRYGGLAAPLAALAVLALAAFLALYFGLAGAAFYRSNRLEMTGKRPWAAIIFAACWLLAELARHHGFTGFPWGASGYAHVDGPLAPLAPWAGVYGIGTAAALLAASLGLALAGRLAWRWVAAALLALVLLQWPGLPAVPTQSSGEVAVSLLQGNIAQGEKFDTAKGVPEALAWYGDELLAARERLVVAPETAIPLLPAQLPEDYWQALRARFARGESAALVGIPLGSHEAGYRNAVVGLRPGADGPPYEYAKHHLVPFGEFIPPGFRWFTELMRIPLGDFTPGALDQPSLAWAGQRWAPNICYEDLFGDELAARFVDPARAPTVMVNLSNIGWFGNGIAIDQHRSISRMRALELARPMIRATNTGATAIIGADGRVQHELPRATRGVLRARVQGREGITPYAWWAGRWGDGPLWLLALLTLLVGAWRGRRGTMANRSFPAT